MDLPSASKTNVRVRLRKRSKRLFGNADRLEVAVAIAQSSGLVHAQELADRLNISPPRVRAQLLTFVEDGMMRSLPRDGLVQNYERLENPFWRSISQLVLAWEQEARSALVSAGSDQSVPPGTQTPGSA